MLNKGPAVIMTKGLIALKLAVGIIHEKKCRSTFRSVKSGKTVGASKYNDQKNKLIKHKSKKT